MHSVMAMLMVLAAPLALGSTAEELAARNVAARGGIDKLHAISSLMHQDVEAADRMIAQLSGLLRYALESTGAQEVTLQQELSFLDRYLVIQQTPAHVHAQRIRALVDFEVP